MKRPADALAGECVIVCVPLFLLRVTDRDVLMFGCAWMPNGILGRDKSPSYRTAIYGFHWNGFCHLLNNPHVGLAFYSPWLMVGGSSPA
jgi:hypothetical protein